MEYQVLVNNTVVKAYPYKTQAVTYCFLNGYVSSGYDWYFLNPKVEIRKVENG